MKFGIATRFLIIFTIFYILTVTIFSFFSNRNAMEGLLSNEVAEHTTLGATLDETIVDLNSLRYNAGLVHTVDMMANSAGARVMVTDLKGKVYYDSKRLQTDMTLENKDLIRISSESRRVKVFLASMSNLHQKYIELKQARSGLYPLTDYTDATLTVFSPLIVGGRLIGQSISSEPLYNAMSMASVARDRLLILVVFWYFVVVAFGLFFTNRFVTSPVERIISVVQKIGAGDLSDRPEFTASDEVSTLGRAIGTMEYNIENMKNKLDGSIRELKENNEGLIHLSSELEQKIEYLQKRQKLIEFDLKLAHNIQQELLPQNYPKIEGIQISAANFQMEEIGGDCFDFYKISDSRLGAFIGDVSGKGISAALVMSMVTILFGQLKETFTSPSQILGKVNEIMYRHFGSQHSIYLTCFFLMIDIETMTVHFSCAGHNPPILFRPETGEITQLESEGFGLGMFQTVNYEQKKIEVLPGDKIILYTDGVVDSRNTQGKMFGVDRLYQTIRDNPIANCYRLTHILVEELEEFAERANRSDDLTIIVIEIEKSKTAAS